MYLLELFFFIINVSQRSTGSYKSKRLERTQRGTRRRNRLHDSEFVEYVVGISGQLRRKLENHVSDDGCWTCASSSSGNNRQGKVECWSTWCRPISNFTNGLCLDITEGLNTVMKFTDKRYSMENAHERFTHELQCINWKNERVG